MFFFFNDTATPEIYTLPLHDALPIYARRADVRERALQRVPRGRDPRAARTHPVSAAEGRRDLRRPSGRLAPTADRKSTRLNSSHANISYAVFCLTKKRLIPKPNQDSD